MAAAFYSELLKVLEKEPERLSDPNITQFVPDLSSMIVQQDERVVSVVSQATRSISRLSS